jgi:hypothetical protein
MDGESILIVLIILAAAAGLIAFFARKRTSPKVPSTPAATGTAHVPATSTTPVVRYTQNVPQPDPVIPIFEDRQIRQVRRCPSCDGENPISAQICLICGRRL